jgi:hypothetical protein
MLKSRSTSVHIQLQNSATTSTILSATHMNFTGTSNFRTVQMSVKTNFSCALGVLTLYVTLLIHAGPWKCWKNRLYTTCLTEANLYIFPFLGDRHGSVEMIQCCHISMRNRTKATVTAVMIMWKHAVMSYKCPVLQSNYHATFSIRKLEFISGAFATGQLKNG